MIVSVSYRFWMKQTPCLIVALVLTFANSLAHWKIVHQNLIKTDSKLFWCPRQWQRYTKYYYPTKFMRCCSAVKWNTLHISFQYVSFNAIYVNLRVRPVLNFTEFPCLLRCCQTCDSIVSYQHDVQLSNNYVKLLGNRFSKRL